MSLLERLNNDVCIRFMIVLFHFLWQGLVIATLAYLAGMLLRRSRSPVRYGVFLAALIIMAVCPVVTFSIIQSSYHISTTATGGAAAVLSEDAPDAIELTAPPVAMSKAVVVPQKVSNPVRALPYGAVENGGTYWKNLPPLVAACYLLGVALFLARLLIGLHGGLRLRQISQPVTDANILAMLSKSIKTLGMRFTPAIACCHRVTVPIVVGILRPMILLPLYMTSGLTPGQVEAILTHELAHIRRYDQLVNLLQRLIETFLFYHPAVWYISGRIRLERENCCDDITVAAGSECLAYAQSLLHLAQQSLDSHNARRLAVAVAAADKPSLLRIRIGRLLGGPVEEIRLTLSWPMAMFLIVAVVVICAVASTGNSQLAATQQTAPHPSTQPTTQMAQVHYNVKLPQGWEKFVSMGDLTLSRPFYGAYVDDKFPTAAVVRVQSSIKNLTNWPLSVTVQYDSRLVDNSCGTGYGIKYVLKANEDRPIDQLVNFASVSVPTRFKLCLAELQQEHDGSDLLASAHVSGKNSDYGLVTGPLAILPLEHECRQAKDPAGAPFELKSLKLEQSSEHGNVAVAELMNRTDTEIRVGVLLGAGDPTNTDFGIHHNPTTIKRPKLSQMQVILKPHASTTLTCSYTISPGGSNQVLVYSIVLYEDGFAGADDLAQRGLAQPYYWGWLDLAAAQQQGLAKLPVELPLEQRVNLTQTKSTEHFNFRYTSDSYAAQHIDKIAQEREAVYVWLSKLFKMELPTKVTIDLYPDMEAKGVGSKTDGTPGNTVNNKQIAEVCDETGPVDKYHELTHIFSYYFPNRTGSEPFGLLEGLAATLEDRNYNPVSASQDLRLKLHQGKLLSLDKVLLSEDTSDEGFTVIDYLLKRDVEKFKKLYVRIDRKMAPEKLAGVVQEIYGTNMADMETGWHEFIKDERTDKSIKSGR